MTKFADKVDTNTVDAVEYNQIVRPIRDMITSGGQSIVDAQNNQVGKSVANYSAGSNFFTDSGSGTAYVLSKVASFNQPTVYTTGFQARFKAGSTNTASATINIETIGVKTLKKLNAAGSKSNLVSGDIIQNRYYKCTYDGTDFILFEDVLNSANNVRDRKLIIKNTAANPTFQTDLTVEFLTVYDGSQNSLVISVGSTLVCDLTVAGVGGLDTGSAADNTWYYLYVVYNPATDDTKLLYSVSATSPTLPAGYSYFRRVSVVRNNNSGNLKQFEQRDNKIVYSYAFGAESPDYRVDSNSLYAGGDVNIDLTGFFNETIGTEIGIFVAAVGNSTQQLNYTVGLPGFTAKTRLARLQEYDISSGTLRIDGELSFYCVLDSYDRNINAVSGSLGSFGANITYFKIDL